jgi:hypothetical protein
MATIFSAITDEQADLIAKSKVFFVASADPDLAVHPDGMGPVNVSPKGGVPLHVISPNEVAYLDFPGSSNETARHSIAGGPVTIMVCSFGEKDAAVVRLYGKASVTPVDESPIGSRLMKGSGTDSDTRPRQVIAIEVESTMTSCGYGVPVMRFVRERQRADREVRSKG